MRCALHALAPRLLGLLALAACKRGEPSTAPVVRADDPPPSVASAQPSKRGANEVPGAVTFEEPLRWGTRPAKDGPLYPVLDGRCIHAELWPLEGGTLLTYDATIENYGNGTSPSFGIFTDEGLSTDAEVGTGFDHEVASSGNVEQVLGRWPDRVLLQLDRRARMSAKGQLWMRDSTGWKLAAKDEEGEKNLTSQGLFLRGEDVVFEELKSIGGTSDYWSRLRAMPLAEGGRAAPVPALVHGGDSPGERLVSGTTWKGELFALVDVFDGHTQVLRDTRAGAVHEERLPSAELAPQLRKGRGFVFLVTPTKLLRYDGTAWSTDDATQGLLSRRRTRLVDAWPDADDGLWIALEDGGLFVRNGDGSMVDRTLPDATPDAGKAVRHGEYVARSGGTVSGLLEGDPWAIGRTGALFHWVSGAWQAVALPAPPFARGAYVPEAVLVRAPGDVFVNAGYSVKEPGWREPDRYRAILRTRRPREVLRCDPSTSVASRKMPADIGPSPPRADDACDHPFVVLTTDVGTTLVDGAQVMATVRGVLRGRAALGGRAAIVEFHYADGGTSG